MQPSLVPIPIRSSIAPAERLAITSPDSWIGVFLLELGPRLP